MKNCVTLLKNKIIYYVLLIFFNLLFLEGLSYVAWIILHGPDRLKNYKETMQTAQNYKFFPKLKVVMPLPGVEMIGHKVGFTDRFPTRDITNLGVGFFDDGINKERESCVVLGDSFALGVGSLNNLEYGWVELVEKNQSWFDMINLSSSGTGQVQQFNFYERVAPLFFHQCIVISFYSGNDFLDNTDAFDWNNFLTDLSTTSDATAFFKNIKSSFSYQPDLDYMLSHSAHSHLIWFLVKLAGRIKPNWVTPPHIKSITQKYNLAIEGALNKYVPSNMQILGHQNQDQAVLIQEENLSFSIYPYQQQDDQAQLLAQHSANLINHFSNKMKESGKKVIVIIHPSQPEVYLLPATEHKINANLDAPVSYLKRYLNPDLIIFDLTPVLKNFAKHSQERLYYPMDGHYTQKGYEVAAKAILESLQNNKDCSNKKFIDHKCIY